MVGHFFLGGGIGSGKSAAGIHFASFGAVVVSGDDAGRRVLAPGTVETARVKSRWPEAVDGSGGIDRRALGRIVFADAAQLRELEQITGPGIRNVIIAAVDARPAEVVLVEVPVLRDLVGREWRWIVVDAPEGVRIERTIARDGRMTADDVRRVMGRQASRGEWLAAAAWVIENGGDEASLAVQCRRVWDEITGA